MTKQKTDLEEIKWGWLRNEGNGERSGALGFPKREGVIVVVDGRLKGSNLLERPTKAIIEQKIPCLFS